MKKLWIIPLLITLFIMGCSSQTSIEPVTIHTDVDSCAECNMGVLEIEHAAQIILKDGVPNVYDDIGCMVTDLKENEGNYEIGYVHDYTSGEWINMKDASFVQDKTIDTPMSYGIIAFQSSDDATKFQTENGGKIMSLDELLQIDMQHLKHHDESSDFHE